MTKIEDLHFYVVDDMRNIRMMVIQNLKKIGASKVSAFEDAADAWQTMEDIVGSSKQPQFIISDSSMPVLKGTEFLEKIRAHEVYRELPFLMLTAENDIATVKQVIAAGVDGFIVKPFSSKTLSDKVAEILRKKSLQKAG